MVHRIGVVALAFLSGCGVRTLAPPAAPEQLPMDIEAHPLEPSEGRGNVFIDTDVPASVERGRSLDTSSSGATDGASTTALCQETPCVATLPHGEHTIRFQALRDEGRSSSARIDLRGSTMVVHHTLGQNRGSSALLPGISLLGTGVVWTAGITYGATSNGWSEELTAAGLLFSLTEVAVGVWLLLDSARTTQEGATTQWVPRSAELGMATTGRRGF